MSCAEHCCNAILTLMQREVQLNAVQSSVVMKSEVR